MTKQQIEQLFKISITVELEKGCWFITGRDWSNYTTINRIRAHRLIYSICIRPLKDGHEICHHCDRRGCINPEHLFQGTHSDNMKDCFKKGKAKFDHYGATPEIKLKEKAQWSKLTRFCQ